MEINSYYLETRHHILGGGVYTIDFMMTLRHMCYMC